MAHLNQNRRNIRASEQLRKATECFRCSACPDSCDLMLCKRHDAAAVPFVGRAGHGLLLFLFQRWGPDLGHITLFVHIMSAPHQPKSTLCPCPAACRHLPLLPLVSPLPTPGHLLPPAAAASCVTTVGKADVQE